MLDYSEAHLKPVHSGMPTHKCFASLDYFDRNSKTRHQRNFRSAVLGEEADDGKPKRRKKKAGPDVNLPDVSRVQMEEVSLQGTDLRLSSPLGLWFYEMFNLNIMKT